MEQRRSEPMIEQCSIWMNVGGLNTLYDRREKSASNKTKTKDFSSDTEQKREKLREAIIKQIHYIHGMVQAVIWTLNNLHNQLLI